MTTKRLLAAFPLIAIAALAACIPPAPEPTPAPEPAPAPAPPPAPTPPPPPPPPPPVWGNWLDAPQTPGDWSYRAGVASFGEPASEPRLVLRCDRDAGVVIIERPGSAAGASLTIRTETTERALSATQTQGPPPAVVAQVPARDALLDAMAFSRGRFAVEAGELPALYVPAWPEVTRVIEDCR